MTQEIPDVKRKDDIKKDHSKYTHTMTVEYPHGTVQNMKAKWREAVEERGQWLENYDKTLSEAIQNAEQMIDAAAEEKKKELERQKNLTEEEKYEEFKVKHKEYIERLEEQLNNIEQTKEGVRTEITKQLEKQKGEIAYDAKLKRDALALWADK